MTDLGGLDFKGRADLAAPVDHDDTAHAPTANNALQPMGVVLDVSGAGAIVALDPERLSECAQDTDPAIIASGQVGSQVKIRAGENWLLATIRSQRRDRRGTGGIIAEIDFLGEGREEKLTGRIHGFRRGITRYPVPGGMVFPASTSDLRHIFASDGRSYIEVGTVFPTRDIRAGLYIDTLLGKHFALLG